MSVPAEESCLALLDDWEAALTLEGRTSSTATLYRRHVTETFQALAASRDLSPDELTLPDCTRRALRAALLSYRDRPDRRHADATLAPAERSPAALRLRLQALRAFFRWCVTEELLPADPTAGLTLTAPPPPPTPSSRSLTPDERARCFELARASRNPARDLALVSLLAGLGCSLGEIVALRLDDLDLSASTLRVTGKPRTLPTAAGRRASSLPRLLTLSPTLRDILQDYLRVRSRTLTRWGRSDEHLLLAGPHALTPPARTRSLAKAATRILDAAGVEHEGRATGLLRASFARSALDAGAPVTQVASLMGLRSLDALRQMVDLTPPAPAPLTLDLLEGC